MITSRQAPSTTPRPLPTQPKEHKRRRPLTHDLLLELLDERPERRRHHGLQHRAEGAVHFVAAGLAQGHRQLARSHGGGGGGGGGGAAPHAPVGGVGRAAGGSWPMGGGIISLALAWRARQRLRQEEMRLPFLFFFPFCSPYSSPFLKFPSSFSHFLRTFGKFPTPLQSTRNSKT